MPKGSPRVSIDGRRWLIDGKVTYPGARAEGLLMNMRMVNSVVVTRQTGSSGAWQYEEYLRRACQAVIGQPPPRE